MARTPTRGVGQGNPPRTGPPRGNRLVDKWAAGQAGPPGSWVSRAAGLAGQPGGLVAGKPGGWVSRPSRAALMPLRRSATALTRCIEAAWLAAPQDRAGGALAGP